MNGCRKVVSSFVILTFIISTITPFKNSYAANVNGLPLPGTMVNLSAAYTPLLIKGLRVHPENPLLFDFIVDTGNSPIKNDSKDLRAESEKLIKYFLATLTIPEKDLWVNLSPYEKDRIIEQPLGETELGRDMLAQDYILKQLTASLIYPEKELGKKFWDKVYAQARERFGSNTTIPVNTFNKVWILPDQADIFVRNNTAFVVGGHLKIMLEEDYLAANKHNVGAGSKPAQIKGENQTQSIIRQIVLPEIEKEVNQGQNFAPLRQIFNSIVLASWYKKNLREALLNQVYTDKSKINGINSDDKAIKEKIYQQYLQAYKKGVFNYIKESNAPNGQVIPRKYFSGGEKWAGSVAVNPAMVTNPSRESLSGVGFQFMLPTVIQGYDPAMTEVPTLTALGAARVLLSGQYDALAEHDFEAWYVAKRKAALRGVAKFNDKVAAEMLNVFGGNITPENVRAILDRRQGRDAAMSSDIGYNGKQLLKSAQEIVDGYKSAGTKIEEAKGYLAPNVVAYLGIKSSVRAHIIEAQGQTETFGVTAVKNDVDGSIDVYLERSFVDRVNKKGANSNRMLERSLVYALAEGTHEEKSVAEFEYFRNTPDVGSGMVDLKKVLGMDIVGLNDFFVNQIPQEHDKELKKVMEKQVKESLWQYALQRLNGENRELRVITHYNDTPLGDDPRDQGDANVIYFPLAANPLHVGQIETALRSLVQAKGDQVVFRIQGIDERKSLAGITQEDRHALSKEFIDQINQFVPGLFSYSSTGLNNGLDGESDLINFLKLNAGRKGGRLLANYLVGSDHMHFFAPDFDRWKKAQKAAKNEPVYPKPGKGPEGYQKDTIQKFEDFFNNEENRAFLKANNMSIFVLFNERDPFESQPIEAETAALLRISEKGAFYSLLRGKNLEGASSSKIRDALAGLGNPKDLTIMPVNIYHRIVDLPKFRGLITELNKSIIESAKGDFQLRDVHNFIGWFDIEDTRGRTHSDQEIANMLTLKEEPVSEDQVRVAREHVNAALNKQLNDVVEQIAVFSNLSKKDQDAIKGPLSRLSSEAKVVLELAGETISQKSRRVDALQEQLKSIQKIVLGLAMERIFKNNKGTPEDSVLVRAELAKFNDASDEEIGRALGYTPQIIRLIRTRVTGTDVAANVERTIEEVATAVGTIANDLNNKNNDVPRTFGVAYQAEIFRTWLKNNPGLTDQQIAEKLGRSAETVSAARSIAVIIGWDKEKVVGVLSQLTINKSNLRKIQDAIDLEKITIPAINRGEFYAQGKRIVVYKPVGYGKQTEAIVITTDAEGFITFSYPTLNRQQTAQEAAKALAGKNAAMSVEEIANEPQSARLALLLLNELSYRIRHNELQGVIKTFYNEISLVDMSVLEAIKARYETKFLGKYIDIAQDRIVDTISVRLVQRNDQVAPDVYKERILEIINEIIAQIPAQKDAAMTIDEQIEAFSDNIVSLIEVPVIGNKYVVSLTNIFNAITTLTSKSGLNDQEKEDGLEEIRGQFDGPLAGGVGLLLEEAIDQKVAQLKTKKEKAKVRAQIGYLIRSLTGQHETPFILANIWKNFDKIVVIVQIKDKLEQGYEDGVFGHQQHGVVFLKWYGKGDPQQQTIDDMIALLEKNQNNPISVKVTEINGIKSAVAFPRNPKPDMISWKDYLLDTVYSALYDVEVGLGIAKDTRIQPKPIRAIQISPLRIPEGLKQSKPLKGFATPEDLLNALNHIRTTINFIESFLRLDDDALRALKNGKKFIDIPMVFSKDERLYKVLESEFQVQVMFNSEKKRWTLQLHREGFQTREILAVELGKLKMAEIEFTLAYKKTSMVDAAMPAPGGIDLNTKNMTTNLSGDKINIQFDKAMIESFKRGDFTGVRPVILNVTPIQSVLPLLGLAPRKEDELAMGGA